MGTIHHCVLYQLDCGYPARVQNMFSITIRPGGCNTKGGRRIVTISSNRKTWQILPELTSPVQRLTSPSIEYQVIQAFQLMAKQHLFEQYAPAQA